MPARTTSGQLPNNSRFQGPPRPTWSGAAVADSRCTCPSSDSRFQCRNEHPCCKRFAAPAGLLVELRHAARAGTTTVAAGFRSSAPDVERAFAAPPACSRSRRCFMQARNSEAISTLHGMPANSSIQQRATQPAQQVQSVVPQAAMATARVLSSTALAPLAPRPNASPAHACAPNAPPAWPRWPSAVHRSSTHTVARTTARLSAFPLQLPPQRKSKHLRHGRLRNCPESSKSRTEFQKSGWSATVGSDWQAVALPKGRLSSGEFPTVAKRMPQGEEAMQRLNHHPILLALWLSAMATPTMAHDHNRGGGG